MNRTKTHSARKTHYRAIFQRGQRRPQNRTINEIRATVFAALDVLCPSKPMLGGAA